ncbi:hypothetical protein OHC51_08185 [Stenotrophomonas indicatrix]|uniref:hypothetical protein n=1 Tax=Stenotrophomonas indicatrix TaxID=2045451 RepID=UPI00300A5322
MKLFTTRLMNYFGFRRILVVNGALNTLAFAEMPWVELSATRTLFPPHRSWRRGWAWRTHRCRAKAFAHIQHCGSCRARSLRGDGICQSTRFIDQELDHLLGRSADRHASVSKKQARSCIDARWNHHDVDHAHFPPSS